jgi:hypothetical protein
MSKGGCCTALDFSKVIEKLNAKIEKQEEQQNKESQTRLSEQESSK